MASQYSPVGRRESAASSSLPSPRSVPTPKRKPTSATPLKPIIVEVGEVQDEAEANAGRRNARCTTKQKQLVGCVVLAIVVGTGYAMSHFLKTDAFQHVLTWLEDNQLLGSVLFVATFSLFIVLCFPSTPFELLAGYIFGFWPALFLSTTGKLLGSLLSYGIGRFLCRDRVRKYMERGHTFFRAFHAMLRKRQVFIVYLIRMAYFPIALKNYGLSVLDVRFSVFFSAALITGLPYSVVWVYTGDAAQQFTALLNNKGGMTKSEAAFLIVGIASALVLLVCLGYYTRKQVLSMAEDEVSDVPASSPLKQPNQVQALARPALGMA